MNEKLKNKILKYSALTSSVIALPFDSNAQIIYQDINPDNVVTGLNDQDTINLNLDGINELIFMTSEANFNGSFASGPYIGQNYINYVNGGFVGGLNNTEMQVNGLNEVLTLNSNDPINNSQNFYNIFPYMLTLGVKSTIVAQSASFSSTSYQGNWPNIDDKFLGLKFSIGSNTHFGWVRLSVTADCDSIILKDYAYNNSPNQGIQAGQTIINSIEENSTEANIHYYQNSLYIKRENHSVEQLEIYSLDGKLIFEKQLDSTFDTISMNEIPKGIYLVKVGNSVKKVII